MDLAIPPTPVGAPEGVVPESGVPAGAGGAVGAVTTGALGEVTEPEVLPTDDAPATDGFATLPVGRLPDVVVIKGFGPAVIRLLTMG
jgi:hypothetical protein